MFVKKLNYIVRHPRYMFQRGAYRLQSLLGNDEYQKFIVLTQGRSGSNMLIDMLNSHEEIDARGELFHRLEGRSVGRILNKVYSQHPTRTKAVGFKIFYQHPLDEPNSTVWEQLLAIDDLQVIHLKRKNLLRRFVSEQIASNTDVWHQHKTETKLDPAQKSVTLSVDEMVEEFQQVDELESHFNALFHQKPMQMVYYEDIIADRGREFRKITDWLGVEPVKPQTALRRQNPEKLPELILNYPEVEAALSGTQWADFLK